MPISKSTIYRPSVIHAMDCFCTELQAILGRKLISVVLTGSAVLDDFVPTRGDLDFIAAVAEELDTDDCSRIFELHDLLREGKHGAVAAQLEGTYYPLSIIRSPKAAFATGCYIGTKRTGWRMVQSCQNSLFDYAIAHQFGYTCWGADIQHEFYLPTRSELIEEIRTGISNARGCLHAANSPSYAAAMFLWGFRALAYAAEGGLMSKSAAAEWYSSHYPGERWARLASQLREMRHPLHPQHAALITPAMRELQPFMEQLKSTVSSLS